MNINNWFQTIETNPVAWNQFASDLEADFLNAIQTRFFVNQSQINFITQLMPSQKELLAGVVRKLSNYLNFDPYPGKKVQGTTLGIVENPPQPLNSIKWEVEGKIEKDFVTGATKGSITIRVSC